MTLRDLVMVPGHGVCKQGCTAPSLAGLSQSWVGIHQDEAKFYVEHAEAAVRHCAQHPDSLLVFSGGQSRADAGPRSEAESYFEIARDHGWWSSPGVAARTILDEYSRDSFENLLFSLHRFRAQTGAWPRRVSVFGWRFKQRRFEIHAAALGWRGNDFVYCGVNDPSGPALARALANEAATVALVEQDPFGAGEAFRNKRAERNPFGRAVPFDIPGGSLKQP